MRSMPGEGNDKYVSIYHYIKRKTIRMSEDSYLLEPKEKKKRTPYEWFMLLLKVTFFICAFTLVIITVLANMGGNGETWHEGVRSFISEFAGGRTAKLEKLNDMSFFPTVRLDIEGVEIYAKPDDVVPLIKLEEFRLGMPFLDVATRSPRLREFYVEGLSTIKGVFMPNEFHLDKLFIDHDQVSPQATFRANGKIGLQSWSFEAGMDVQKSLFGNNTYVMAQKAPFVFDFADVHFAGLYDHVSANHLKIENFELRTGEKIISGDVVVSTTSDKLIKVQGTLNIQNGQSIITPNLLIDSSHKGGAPTQISGEITSEKLVIDDVIGEESIFGILARVRELLGYEGVVHRADGTPVFLGTDDLNLHVFLQNVEAGNVSYDALSFDVLQEAGRLRISKVVGKDERELMPPVMLMQDPSSKRLVSVMQDGRLEVGLVSPWLKHLPLSFLAKQTTNVSCGIGVFLEDKDQGVLNIESLVVETSDGIITTRERALSEGETPLDLHYMFSADVSLEAVSLPKEHYDFVRASLQEAGKGSPCTPYISLQEPKQEELKQEVSEE